MKPATTEDILDLMDGYIASASVGAALELGLFWLLDEQSMDARDVAVALDIPENRCRYWLQFLENTGLIEYGPRGYQPSPEARKSILEAYSHNTWALLAEDARQRHPVFSNLTPHLKKPGAAVEGVDITSPDYIALMDEDPDRARQFTRMLFELHQPLAEELARSLDMGGVDRFMDLGGGSGVMSMALLQRNPRCTAVVVDIANVCAAGREIAAERSLEERMAYQPVDFLHGELPKGFDLVLECDVNVYSEALFRKVRTVLNPGGRFVIVDQFSPSREEAPPPRLHWAFEGAMENPDYRFPTAAEIRSLLEKAGFRLHAEGTLSPNPGVTKRFTSHLVIIEAIK